MSTGLSLAKQSWLPSFVKTNFIQHSVERVRSKCSASLSQEDIVKCKNMCVENLTKNGYSAVEISNALTKNKKNKRKNYSFSTDKSILKIPFVNDCLIRKVNNLKKKYKIQANLVSVGNKKLRHALKPKNRIYKHKNCNICDQLPDQHNCEKAGVVYQFKCNACSSSYIGKTCRPFHLRYKEHSYSVNKNNFLSALSDHVQVCSSKSINDFSVNFLASSSDPVEVTLLESRFIDLLKPILNRRHEGAGFARLEVR